MANNVELINGMRKNFRDNEDQKLTNSRQGTMEKLVDGQDVLPFQPTGSEKFESFASGVSDNQSTKT